MPSLGDSAFIFVLALLLFGPKKLPELARQLGKLMGEFRRASNEFRMQMEDELRISEQAERQKEIAAIEAAAPVRPAIDPVPADTTGATAGDTTVGTQALAEASAGSAEPSAAVSEVALPPIEDPLDSHPHMISRYPAEAPASVPQEVIHEPAPAATEPIASAEPLPIATSGSLKMRPPKTGMPFAHSIGMAPGPSAPAIRSEGSAPLSPLFDAIPHAASPETAAGASEPVTAGAQDPESRGMLQSTEASHHG